MTESIQTIRGDVDNLTKIQQVDRNLAAQAVELANAQQDVLRTLWPAFKQLLAILAYAQAQLVDAGEHDVAGDLGQKWAGVLDRVYTAVVAPRRLN